MGARSAGNPHAALRRGGGWKRGTAEILGHSQAKGRANRGNKLRPKPVRQFLDPTDERGVETELWPSH